MHHGVTLTTIHIAITYFSCGLPSPYVNPKATPKALVLRLSLRLASMASDLCGSGAECRDSCSCSAWCAWSLPHPCRSSRRCRERICSEALRPGWGQELKEPHSKMASCSGLPELAKSSPARTSESIVTRAHANRLSFRMALSE